MPEKKGQRREHPKTRRRTNHAQASPSHEGEEVNMTLRYLLAPSGGLASLLLLSSSIDFTALRWLRGFGFAFSFLSSLQLIVLAMIIITNRAPRITEIQKSKVFTDGQSAMTLNDESTTKRRAPKGKK